METCYLCFEGRAVIAFESWDFASLKLIRDMFRTCPKHSELVKRRIEIFEADEPKKYVLKPQGSILQKTGTPMSPNKQSLSHRREKPVERGVEFLPPILKEPIKNYQDREPGEEG